MAEIGQGHNSPPFDFNEFFDLVVSSPASAQQKLIQLVIARRAQKAGGKASPRRAEILADASCSEATFKRSYGLLKAFFEVNPVHGSTTEYTPKSCITITDIETALENLTIKTKGHGDTGSQRARYQKDGVSVIPGSQSEGLTDTGVSESEGHGDTTKKRNSPTPPKEKTIPNNNHPSLETAGAGDVHGLNGATAHIVKTLGEWINPIMPDHRTARGWLESSVSMYGGVVVRDSFAELEAKILQGDIVARPIPLLTKICQRRKTEKPANARDPTEKPPDMPEKLWREIQAGKARERV
jgi:hypothetical protein